MRALPLVNPVARWDTCAVVHDDGEGEAITLETIEDHSRSILAENDSPDVGFRWSVNPYRGCFHGCAYCYARPTHEYLSLGAGTDFERRIVYKPKAPELLREAFERPSWKGDFVMMSGVTDCYQPLENKLGLTRGCLEVCLAYRNPAGIITKSPLVERDAELLAELGKVAGGGVAVSIPFWNEEHARAMEPFVTTPARRMRIVERLARAGVTVGVSVAPVIPGLSDEDIPRILERARDAGASYAFHVLLRLPRPVDEIFRARLEAALPLRAAKVLRRVAESQGGKMYDARFGVRGRGTGPYAEAIAALFARTARSLGLDARERWAEDRPSTFARPRAQLTLPW